MIDNIIRIGFFLIVYLSLIYLYLLSLGKIKLKNKEKDEEWRDKYGKTGKKWGLIMIVFYSILFIFFLLGY